MCGRKRAQCNGAGLVTYSHDSLAYNSNGNGLISDMHMSVNKNHQNGLGMPFLAALRAPHRGTGEGRCCNQRHACRSEGSSRGRSGGPISMLVMLVAEHYEDKKKRRLEAERMLLVEEKGEWQVEGLVEKGPGEKNEGARDDVSVMSAERRGEELRQRDEPPSYELAVSSREALHEAGRGVAT